MRRKHPGICSNCRKQITPHILEQNYVIRDVCRCPNCQESILVCRTPGCDNYAKGGDIYDDELCFECIKSASEVLTTTAKAVATGLATVASGLAVNYVKDMVDGSEKD